MAKLYSLEDPHIKTTFPILYQVLGGRQKANHETGYMYFMRVRQQVKNRVANKK